MQAETPSGWHAKFAVEVARLLGADSERGLSAQSAARRLAESGPNIVSESKRDPWWEELLESLREPLQLLLIGVGVVYAALGELQDALTIFVVILAFRAGVAGREHGLRRGPSARQEVCTPIRRVKSAVAPGCRAVVWHQRRPESCRTDGRA